MDQEATRTFSRAHARACASVLAPSNDALVTSSDAFVTSSFLLLVAMPGDPSSVLARSSDGDALVTSGFLLPLVAMPGAPSSTCS